MRVLLVGAMLVKPNGTLTTSLKVYGAQLMHPMFVVATTNWLRTQVSILAGVCGSDGAHLNGAGLLARFDSPYAIAWARDKVTNDPVLYVADR